MDKKIVSDRLLFKPSILFHIKKTWELKVGGLFVGRLLTGCPKRSLWCDRGHAEQLGVLRSACHF